MNEHKDEEGEKNNGNLKEAVEDKADAERRIAEAKTIEAEKAQELADDAKESIEAS